MEELNRLQSEKLCNSQGKVECRGGPNDIEWQNWREVEEIEEWKYYQKVENWMINTVNRVRY